MPNLSVRKLDSHIYERLRKRAAKHGISIEEEVRQIIFQAVTAPEKIGDVFQKYFGADDGVNLEILDQRNSHNPKV